jgi:hypothetical protein
MQVNIDRVVEVSPGVWSFNALLRGRDETKLVFSCWRILKGKIYAPAVKVKGQYIQTCFLDEETVANMYGALLACDKLTEDALLPYDKATGTLRPSQRALETFLPTLAAQGGS